MQRTRKTWSSIQKCVFLTVASLGFLTSLWRMMFVQSLRLKHCSHIRLLKFLSAHHKSQLEKWFCDWLQTLWKPVLAQHKTCKNHFNVEPKKYFQQSYLRSRSSRCGFELREKLIHLKLLFKNNIYVNSCLEFNVPLRALPNCYLLQSTVRSFIYHSVHPSMSCSACLHNCPCLLVERQTHEGKGEHYQSFQLTGIQ